MFYHNSAAAAYHTHTTSSIREEQQQQRSFTSSVHSPSAALRAHVKKKKKKSAHTSHSTSVAADFARVLIAVGLALPNHLDCCICNLNLRLVVCDHRVPSLKWFIGRCSSPSMRLAEHLTALRAWCTRRLPGR